MFVDILAKKFDFLIWHDDIIVQVISVDTLILTWLLIYSNPQCFSYNAQYECENNIIGFEQLKLQIALNN